MHKETLLHCIKRDIFVHSQREDISFAKRCFSTCSKKGYFIASRDVSAWVHERKLHCERDFSEHVQERIFHCAKRRCFSACAKRGLRKRRCIFACAKRE
jgi:hypothetical protein